LEKHFNDSKKKEKKYGDEDANAIGDDDEDSDNELDEKKDEELDHAPQPPVEERRQPSSCELLKDRDIFLGILLYSMIAFTSIMSNELFPLWAIVDKEHHGFDFKTNDIGMTLSIIGPTQLIYTIFMYPRLTKAYGIKKVCMVRLNFHSFFCYFHVKQSDL